MNLVHFGSLDYSVYCSEEKKVGTTNSVENHPALTRGPHFHAT